MSTALHKTSVRVLIASLAVLLLSVTPMALGEEAREPAVRVAQLRYGPDHISSVCFATGFLESVDRETSIRVERSLGVVDLESERVFEYPFLIMAGDQAFALTDDQRQRLGEYLKRGGFVLASAGCSSAAWADSFRKAIAAAMPEHELKPLPTDHPLFNTLYRIEQVIPRRSTDLTTLYGLYVGDRLAMVFSPLGLNDTDAAGGGCCCCGGNEIRNARQINANLLVYVLTH